MHTIRVSSQLRFVLAARYFSLAVGTEKQPPSRSVIVMHNHGLNRAMLPDNSTMKHQFQIFSARHRNQSGMTLLELILAIGILVVLVGAAIPMLHDQIVRPKEEELRRDL